MTYSLSLANIVPSASAFVVRVNTTTRSVSKVVVSGTKVQLTLASNVAAGDVVTVAYTKPTRNQIQSTTGAQAATISAQTVTNNVIAAVPVYVSSVIANATPSLLEMTYSLTLANKVPAISAFAVTVNSATRSVTKVAVSGTRVQLTLGSPVVSGDVVVVSYTRPATNPLQTASGGMAVNIAGKPVTNNTVNRDPVISITSPANNTPFVSPANITITASASDSDGTITLVEFYNGTTKLGSASAVPWSFAWDNVEEGTYSLTATVTDNRNARIVSSAISVTVTAAPVSINQPPVVTISSPTKGNEYETPTNIDIAVAASDPDGSISRVVLYNGSTKLVELTNAPYLYTWKNVKTGNYSIKAFAYDNLNATATSSVIEFKVGGGPVYDANSEIINLYPNPNDGNFSIEFLQPIEDEKCKIVITDLGGKQVSIVPVLEGETIKHFNLSYIKSGIYIMMVISKGILVTKKFIKY
jgi:uncharacterized repeat protein (TIGR02059 family)